jgi:hypothetical protein
VPFGSPVTSKDWPGRSWLYVSPLPMSSTSRTATAVFCPHELDRSVLSGRHLAFGRV